MSVRAKKGSGYKITTYVIFLYTHQYVDSIVLLLSFSLIFLNQRKKNTERNSNAQLKM